MRMRGGAGLGDAIYLRVVAEYFVRLGNNPVIVCSDFPDAFEGSGALPVPFDRFGIDVLAHYTVGKRNLNTNQWQDICASARIAEIALRFKWKVKNQALVDAIQRDAQGKKIILVHGGRVPMGRTDGFGMELLPKREAFEEALLAAQDAFDAFTVRVGRGADLYPLPVSVDLNGATSVTDLFDLAQVCEGIIGQCSFAVPLAEVFDKPLLAVWAAHGMEGHHIHPYIRQITPKKVLSKRTSKFVIDNWSQEQIREVARSFMALEPA